MKTADIVLSLFDATAETKEEMRLMEDELKTIAKSYLLVGNKIDDQATTAVAEKKYQLNEAIYISARDHINLEVLKKALVGRVVSGSLNTENIIVTNARHYQSLQKVSNNIMAIREGMKNNVSGDLIAIDIRQCLYYLGEITGEISNEDQLDFIFSKFCIGK